MKSATSTEFRRRFGQVRKAARKKPISITRRGKRAFVVMSAEHYDLLKSASEVDPKTRLRLLRLFDAAG
jgi:prevent-host-death family protein